MLTFQTSDSSHQIKNTINEKNHKVQYLGNETLNNEIEKKITQKIPKQKISIKRNRVKIKIKKINYRATINFQFES